MTAGARSYALRHPPSPVITHTHTHTNIATATSTPLLYVRVDALGDAAVAWYRVPSPIQTPASRCSLVLNTVG